MPRQLKLFENYQVKLYPKNEKLCFNKEGLIKWKQKIYNYQLNTRNKPQPRQRSLFEITPAHWDSEHIDPFTLRIHPYHFFEMPNYDGHNCLYFIIDQSLPLLLYVGETKRSPKQRWITHDCKHYISNYISLHREHKLEVLPTAAFYHNIPPHRKLRQKMEKDLILKWRSPFNRESWYLWGQPFGKE